MTSPQPVARNHRPSQQLPAQPEARPRTLQLKLEEGQLRKRIHLFEELTSPKSKDESKGEDTNNGFRCRQPRVISPEQKRWTQLDFTNEELGSRKEVSRQRHAQHTMHPGHKRSPVLPPPPKPLLSPRRGKVEIKVPPSEPLVNGKPAVQAKRERPLTVTGDDARAKRDEKNRNSVLALVSAFENGKSTVAVERKSKMLTVPESGRVRTISETSESTSSNGTMSLSRRDPDRLTPSPLQKNRMSRSMDSLVKEFEIVAIDLSRNSTRHRSDGSSSPDIVITKPDPDPHNGDPVPSKPDPVPSKRNPAPHDGDLVPCKPDPVPSKRDPFPSKRDPAPRNGDPVPHKEDWVPCRPEPVPHEGDLGPHKPGRTFEQDIYDESKLQESKTKPQVIVIVNGEDEESEKPSITRLTKPKRTYEQDVYNKSKALRLKHCLSNGDALKEIKAPEPVPRTKSARRAILPPEYYQVNPENTSRNPIEPSRNCNHNVETEDTGLSNGYLGYEEVSGEFFPIPGKRVFDPLVIDNNNQSSFLNMLKSPGGRRHRMTSSSPTQAKTHPTSPPPQIPQTPPQPPSRTPKRHQPPSVNVISSETFAKEKARLLSPPTSPLNDSGCISPETQRRMTDSALIGNLSPRAQRRNMQETQRTNLSPIMGEYAEPINIKRSFSDESLATLRRPATVTDNQGYSVPGSHLWEAPKFHTMKPKSSAKLVIEQRLHSNSISQPVLRRQKPPKLEVEESRDVSWNGCTQEVVRRPTKTAGVPAQDVKKEGGFRQRSKLLTMRRKINDAFRRKPHHQKTEDDRISVTSEGSDSEVNEQILKSRLTYVRTMRLRSSVYCTMPARALQYSKLYEYAVIVSLKINPETRRYEPYEMRRFPHEVSDSQTDKLRAIPEFCFPDAFKWAPVEQYNSESFCFVLTSSDGSRVYGYNRRMLPPGKGPRLPEVVCVMSPIGCYPIYNQLLDEIENRRKHSMAAVENLLKLSYESPFPRPGHCIKVSTPPNNNNRRKNIGSHLHYLQDPKPLLLQRPADQRLEHVDFDTLFNCLSVNRIVQIFASLLLERRVIMCSGKLSKLSRCSQALVGLLYPFSWQHVYVPVLPEKLIDMCCSPTPYIMGMLSLCIPRLEEMPLEEVLVVDLDAKDFYTVIGDEGTILPKKLSAALERALKVCSMSSWEGADTDDELSEDHESKNSAISEAFIRFFVETVGHYSNHFTQAYDDSQKFDRESFIKAVSSKSVRNFLEVFSETQMFSLFIQEKESESEGISQGLFERRVREFENESKSNSKNIGAKMKKFGKAVKDIKDSAKTAQKRMKQNFEDKI
ncbi:DENN domain-containing protein 2A isoform X2 [Strongylocentrotus purpuratus]|uniref:UDENN domain-containing protein n=1 Tax=Strongylocentrotus purpuratus TaxID=7668 RepID=A0A7M7P2L4_STRPU|nr:DENN domain-containing protein 2A isoform X2 [Strongylocentrotus purpuratus]